MKGLCIAFALYSKIPVPQVAWTTENKKYTICFFPLIGVVIAAVAYAWYWLAKECNLGVIMTSAILIALPILITGGIHVDGYMDTQDALNSYGSKEKKLQILKDPHIGAFSVIMLLLYYVIAFGASTEINTEAQIISLGIGFVLSRSLSGLAIASFKSAKKEGMLYEFSDVSHQKIVRFVLLFYVLICGILLFQLHIISGLMILIGNAILFAYYRYKSYKEVDGITGDLAGWFLQLSELLTLLCLCFVR